MSSAPSTSVQPAAQPAAASESPRNSLTTNLISSSPPRQVRRNWFNHVQERWQHVSRGSRIVLIITLLLSVAQIATTSVILALYWTRPCDRPLNIYLILFCVRVLLLIPVSLTLHLRRGGPSASRDSWVDRLKSMLDLFGTLLFLVGNYLLFTVNSCQTTNPPVFYLSLAFVILGYLVITIPVLLCGAIIFCLPCLLVGLRVTGMGRVVVGGPTGLSDEDINKLERVVFKLNRVEETHVVEREQTEKQDKRASKSFMRRWSKRASDMSLTPIKEELKCVHFDDPQDAVCSICLENYEDNDVLRKLPCKHMFHEACVDEWLRLNATCPLCKAQVKQEPAEAPAV